MTKHTHQWRATGTSHRGPSDEWKVFCACDFCGAHGEISPVDPHMWGVIEDALRRNSGPADFLVLKEGTPVRLVTK